MERVRVKWIFHEIACGKFAYWHEKSSSSMLLTDYYDDDDDDDFY